MQVVRLIRSKGVGVYFVTQNPLDVPETVLGQLGNRVQHALRAFTPKDQKAVRAAAETFRTNPNLNVAQAITQLAVGEALVSFLEETGTPGIVERALDLPAAQPDRTHHARATQPVDEELGCRRRVRKCRRPRVGVRDSEGACGPATALGSGDGHDSRGPTVAAVVREPSRHVERRPTRRQSGGSYGQERGAYDWEFRRPANCARRVGISARRQQALARHSEEKSGQRFVPCAAQQRVELHEHVIVIGVLVVARKTHRRGQCLGGFRQVATFTEREIRPAFLEARRILH